MIFEGTAFDNVLHILTVLLSLVLFAISLSAYFRTKKIRFLYICGAFFLFSAKEMITVYSIFVAPSAALTGIAHILTFAILILFFVGVMK